MLKVLLVAPTDPDKPSDLKLLVGGENTYTRSLLAYPPGNVKYTYFLEALGRGEIKYTFLHRILSILTKLRILPIGAGSQGLCLKADFDLVHCHAYGIKIDREIPVILSDSSSNYLFLRDYVNWPIWRIKLGLAIKKLLFKIFNVLDPDINIGNSRLIVFSKFAFKIHQKLGISSGKMQIIHPGLPKISYKKADPVSSGEVNILFVGIWFERKGGHLLLEAFKQLSKKYKNIRLTVVGEVPNKSKVRSEKCKVYDFIPRERLMREFFPKADIFVLIPPKVEGFGFSVLEAMSFGLVPIVSDVCALPELINDGKTGFVVKPGSVDDLVTKLELLIVNKKLRLKMGTAARNRFEESFSIKNTNVKLLKIYEKVLNEG